MWRTISLIGMTTNTKFSNCPKVFKMEWFSSKISTLCIKIRFKATQLLQSLDKMHFLPLPLIFCLLTGYCFDRIMSECIVIFRRVFSMRKTICRA